MKLLFAPEDSANILQQFLFKQKYAKLPALVVKMKANKTESFLKHCTTSARPAHSEAPSGTSPDPCSSEHLLNMINQQEGTMSCSLLKIIQFNLSLLHQIFFPCNFTTSLLLCEENVRNPV